jgi:methylthioxylose transferase
MSQAVFVDERGTASWTTADGSVRTALWAAVVVSTTLSLAVSYWTASQQVVIGSVEGGWVYPYIAPLSQRTMATFVVVAASVWGLLSLLRVGPEDRVWRPMLAWVVAATGLQAALRSLTPFSFGAIFASDGANSFYGVTRSYFVSTVLKDFERVRTFWPLHAHSNMPGKVLLVRALELLSTRPEVLAWLVVALSNAGAVLMYVFVRDLLDDRRAGLFAFALYLFVPAKLLFFPLLNTVSPVLVLASGCVLLRLLRTGASGWAVLLGVSVYALAFFEPLTLAVGLLFGVLSLQAIGRGTTTWRRLTVQALLASLAFIATAVAVRVGTGFDLFHAFVTVRADAVAFNEEAGRPYAIWIGEDLREFFIGAGVGTGALVIAAIGDGFERSRHWRSWLVDPIVGCCLGWLAVVVAIDLLGINRGEVTRLWIFLACFAQIPVAYVCARLANRAALAAILTTYVLQVALGTAMIGFILP